jgi:hypothetical protein
MPTTPRSYALTTVDRVRNVRLTIETDQFDDLFVNLVNSVSDFIEGECGRRFLRTNYVDQLYTIHSAGQNFLVLKQSPVTTVSSFQFRLGPNVSAQWIDFDPNVWELLEGGESGIIEVLLGSLPKYLKVSFTAGYLIDWDQYSDETLHTLPSDLTDLAERLVIRLFKRRESEGKASDAFERSQIAWRDVLIEEDKRVLDRYRRLPTLT